MSEYIKIGKIVNTHGIKGEIRILANIEYLDRIFVIGNKVYIGENFTAEEITSYRHHKEYEMITLKNINNINDVLKYKGQNIYFKYEDLKLNSDEHLLEEYLGLEVTYGNSNLGKIIDILQNNGNIVFVIEGKKKIYIPKNEHFIKKLDFKLKKIEVINVEGLI